MPDNVAPGAASEQVTCAHRWGLAYWCDRDMVRDCLNGCGVRQTLTWADRHTLEAENRDLRRRLGEVEDAATWIKRSRDDWRTLARSRKDQKLVDAVIGAEMETKVARQAALYMGDKLEQAEAAIRTAIEALEKIAYGKNTSYLACSDVPNCQGIGPHGHAEDCAVGIARVALDALRKVQPSREEET